jgi:hypothetical protein
MQKGTCIGMVICVSVSVCLFVCLFGCLHISIEELQTDFDKIGYIHFASGRYSKFIVQRCVSTSVKCSVRPSVCTHETTGEQLDRFSWKLETGEVYDNVWRHLDYHLGQKNLTYPLYIKIYTGFCVYLTKYLLERNMS